MPFQLLPVLLKFSSYDSYGDVAIMKNVEMVQDNNGYAEYSIRDTGIVLPVTSNSSACSNSLLLISFYSMELEKTCVS